MADHQSSSPSSPTRPISSFLGSPRLFNGFTLTKTQSDPESSPKSILETKLSPNFTPNPFGFNKDLLTPAISSLKPTQPSEDFNGFPLTKSQPDPDSSPKSILETKFNSNPFGFNKNPVKPQKTTLPSESFESENGIALALVLVQQNPTANSVTRKVIFGSKLKIQIPTHPQSDPSENGLPESPGDFGIKTRNFQFTGAPTTNGSGSPRTPMSLLSLKEMELSEEYTRVISHGSNPKITHIYDDCVVESSCGNLTQKS